MLSDWAWVEREVSSRKLRDEVPQATHAQEAEILLREVLAVRRAADPDHWRSVMDVPSRLAGALLSAAATDLYLLPQIREQKLVEAQNLLMESYRVVQRHEQNPVLKKIDTKYQQDLLTRLIRLYQFLGKKEQVAQYQQELEILNFPDKDH